MSQNNFKKLIPYGWDEKWQTLYQQYKKENNTVGRILRGGGGIFIVFTVDAEVTAVPSGNFRYTLKREQKQICVGDWVVITKGTEYDKAHIIAQLPRSSCLLRQAAGRKTESQELAVNMDILGIIYPLDRPLRHTVIERYMTLAWDSGSEPLLLLNKADLSDNLPEVQLEAEAIAIGVKTITISALTGNGLDPLYEVLKEGVTIALIGPSGAGKSTLVNRLIGESAQDTGSIRASDGRGRHTTTGREIFILPSGGCVLDTPGLRETGLWVDGEGLNQTFSDVAELATGCRFTNCSHLSEPGCAVKQAIATGVLSSERFLSYQKLLKEQEFIKSRKDEKSRRDYEKRWIDVIKFHKNLKGRK